MTDGFENFLAGLGLGQNNQLAKGSYTIGSQITRQRSLLEAAYRDSWVVGRMVDVVAEDMLRGGIDIQAQLPPGDIDELHRYIRRMGVYGRLCDAVKWARLYGGALAVILIQGDDVSQPLDVEDVRRDSFRGLHVLDRWQVVPSSETIDELGPMLGYPVSYDVNTGNDEVGLRVHHSRCVRLIGVELPYYQRITELQWGASVVERAYDRILALDSATHGTANLMFRSYLRTIRVKRLREILAAGGAPEQALLKMFAMIRLMQTNEGITLLDSEDEFQTNSWTFAGAYDGIQAFAEQIAGATGIPLVRLMGQSPKGFSTGDTDLRTYYDTIATQQDDDLRPVFEKLLPIIARSRWGKPLPEGWSFEFRSLWQPSETDKSTIATADAQSVAGLHSAGIITLAQALGELRDASRITGRWSGITDGDINRAHAEASAPTLPELGEGGTQPGEAGGDGPTPQEISLNGAQVTSMVEIVTQVASGQLPRESGIQMLRAAFPVSLAQAEQIMGSVGRGFIPAVPADEATA
jgi:phage-related protein (TIGR01555 family)